MQTRRTCACLLIKTIPGKLANLLIILTFTVISANSFASCPAPDFGKPLPAEAIPTRLIDHTYGYWYDRFSQIQKSIDTINLTEVKLVFIGDSIVERWDHVVFSAHYSHFSPLNLGISQDNIQGLLFRLPGYHLGSTLRPKLIVLLIGTNNTFPGSNARNISVGIGEVIKLIRHESPTSRILLLAVLPRGSNARDPWREEGKKVNGLIAACADGRHIFYADLGGTLAGPKQGVSPELEADYLHPTVLGYQKLSESLDPIIARLMK